MGALDFAMIVYQNDQGNLSPALVLTTLFHYIYVLDSLYFEPLILTTMDITTDGFGFMLAFGDLVWVPSIYTIQARYLVDYPIELSNLAIVLLLALNLGGYYIFRSANKQKDTFRKNPNHPDVR